MAWTWHLAPKHLAGAALVWWCPVPDQSLNMGEWSNGLCILLRPSESSWEQSTPIGKLSLSRAGPSREDMETLSNDFE